MEPNCCSFPFVSKVQQNPEIASVQGLKRSHTGLRTGLCFTVFHSLMKEEGGEEVDGLQRLAAVDTFILLMRGTFWGNEKAPFSGFIFSDSF